MLVSVIGIIRSLLRPVLLAFFYLLFLSSCQRDEGPPVWYYSGSTMGTTWSLKVLAPSKNGDAKRELQAKLELALAAVSQKMSTYIPDSELSRFNQAPTMQWIEVSKDLCYMFTVSKQVSDDSDGAFDITVGPLVNAWGFGPGPKEQPPTAGDIAKLKEKVGYKYLEFDCGQLRARKMKDLYVDLSAVAKGYATDVLAKVLEDENLHDYMVEIGGELHLSGHNEHGKPWRIGIEKPELVQGETAQIIELSDVGLATSGDYRNYYEYHGKKYSHTIDPFTGYPVTHNLASITVVAKNGAYADAYATAFDVLGPIKGKALAEKLGMDAYFIVRTESGFSIDNTAGFKHYMVNE